MFVNIKIFSTVTVTKSNWLFYDILVSVKDMLNDFFGIEIKRTKESKKVHLKSPFIYKVFNSKRGDNGPVY